MKMPPPTRRRALREWLAQAYASPARTLWSIDQAVALGDIARGTSLRGRLDDLAGRSVLIATEDQLTAALALLDLDGVARRMTLCPPDLHTDHLFSVVAAAEADVIVTNRDRAAFAGSGVPLVLPCGLPLEPAPTAGRESEATEWVLLTSGTTGPPKLVAHSLAALTAAIAPAPPRERPMVWGTFYDIRRYGGLQIFLRTILGNASLVLSSADEPVAEHLHRLGAHGVTHISGTSSHWRRVLMSTAATAISPEYIRLSGEIADQAILDSLHQFYPHAAIGHAYASTEAGVGFEVRDGREGFPTSLVGAKDGAVQMKVEDGSLRIRSARAASRYVGDMDMRLGDDDGFVDTGDMVEPRGDRFYFVGRRGGIINVGGLKVHPEEVEAVINRHRSVRMSLVRSRRSPIIGAIVVADIVLEDAVAADGTDAVKGDILRMCREALACHKVPASIRFVASLDVTTAGKLARHV